MAKRPKKFGLKVKVKITPGTKKKAGEGKEEVGLTKELQESQRIKINKEGKKVILSGQEEKVERDKKLMMWAGVSFFMVLILALWVLNIKSIFIIYFFSHSDIHSYIFYQYIFFSVALLK